MMANDQELMMSIRAAIDDCTRGVDEAPSLRCKVLRKAKGMKRPRSVTRSCAKRKEKNPWLRKYQ